MNLFNAARILLLGVGFLLTPACTGTQPLPTPIGPATDAASLDAPLPLPAFDHKVFDCRLDIVKIEYDGAKPDVKKCLSSTGAPDCLVKQAGQHDPATVACLARDLGGVANAAVLAGSSDPVDATVAAAARSFINSQTLGYR